MCPAMILTLENLKVYLGLWVQRFNCSNKDSMTEHPPQDS